MASVNVMRCKLVRECEITGLINQRVTSTETAVDVFRAYGLEDETEEKVIMLCLNSKGSIMGVHEVSHGDKTSSIVNPSDVFKRALLNNATHIIVAHNHPSGDCTPSQEDIDTTKRLKKCGDLLGVRVTDHIIIGDGYSSLLQMGYM